jgi:hypothetical protein
MATETLNRAQLALTADALPHANNLAYTVPAATKSTVYINIANIHASASAYVDVAVDVLGAGTTIRYLTRNVLVPQGASLVLPALNLLATDRLRIRASAAGYLDAYVSIIELA